MPNDKGPPPPKKKLGALGKSVSAGGPGKKHVKNKYKTDRKDSKRRG